MGLDFLVENVGHRHTFWKAEGRIRLTVFHSIFEFDAYLKLLLHCGMAGEALLLIVLDVSADGTADLLHFVAISILHVGPFLKSLLPLLHFLLLFF